MTRAGAYWAGGGISAILAGAITGAGPIVGIIAVLLTALLVSYLDRRID